MTKARLRLWMINYDTNAMKTPTILSLRLISIQEGHDIEYKQRYCLCRRRDEIVSD